MRLMGIDYGKKRIGIALSDESGGFAFAHGVVENNKGAIGTIKKICEENNVGKIILGESVDYKGQPNPIMAEIDNFKKKMENEINLPIEYQKEVLTTKEAERLQEGNKKIDASAAALILRSFLEKKK
jgi:putative Holliday junction resolvase